MVERSVGIAVAAVVLGLAAGCSDTAKSTRVDAAPAGDASVPPDAEDLTMLTVQGTVTPFSGVAITATCGTNAPITNLTPRNIYIPIASGTDLLNIGDVDGSTPAIEMNWYTLDEQQGWCLPKPQPVTVYWQWPCTVGQDVLPANRSVFQLRTTP